MVSWRPKSRPNEPSLGDCCQVLSEAFPRSLSARSLVSLTVLGCGRGTFATVSDKRLRQKLLFLNSNPYLKKLSHSNAIAHFSVGDDSVPPNYDFSSSI